MTEMYIILLLINKKNAMLLNFEDRVNSIINNQDYITPLNPVMIPIKSGYLKMGASINEIKNSIKIFDYAFKKYNEKEVFDWFCKSVPPFEVFIQPFKVSKFLVTNKEYNYYSMDKKNTPFLYPKEKVYNPVENITFKEANDYCIWLSNKTDRKFRLLTEPEWEWCVRKDSGNLFPWGNEFNKKRCNTLELGLNDTTPVGLFNEGESMDGISDLAGNLEEWVSNKYIPYKGGNYIKDHLAILHDNNYYILRGGSYKLNADLCLAYRRHGFYPKITATGFRICEDI